MLNRVISMGIILLFTVSCVNNKKKDVAIISSQYGDMVIQFFEEDAPKHVENFRILAKKGYFDGTTFHRVIPGFMIQGGDPNSKDDNRMNDGQGGHAAKYYGFGEKSNKETWTLPAEYNDIRHKKGIVAMARSLNDNSAGSQFYIYVADIPRLDGKYTVFGMVVEGMEVVEQIANVKTPIRENSMYQGSDLNNPYEKVVMTIRLEKRDYKNLSVERFTKSGCTESGASEAAKQNLKGAGNSIQSGYAMGKEGNDYTFMFSCINDDGIPVSYKIWVSCSGGNYTISNVKAQM